jgi:hypothetical protein
MKFSAAIALIGLMTVAALPLHAEEPNFGPEIRYTPEQRFAVPVSKVTGLNNAKNVVIKEVPLSSLPDFVRIQVETLAETCTKSADNKKLMKFYRYTSDAARDNSLSPSYLADMSGLAGKEQQACVLGNMCTKDGCFLVGYNSTAYEKWGQQFVFRQKGWEYKKVKDDKVKAELTVFYLNTACKAAPAADKKDKDDKGCLAKRVWLDNGFVEYKEGGMMDNVAPYPEQQQPEDATDEQQQQPEQQDDTPAPSSAAPSDAPPADTQQ